MKFSHVFILFLLPFLAAFGQPDHQKSALPKTTGYNFSSVGFADKSHGWAAGGSYSDGYLYSTKDGGRSWQLLFTTGYGITSISAVDSNTVWISGDIISVIKNGVKYDILGYQHYSLPIIKYPRVTFTDQLHGWSTYSYESISYVNYGIEYTRDGGKTWNFLNFDRYSGVGFNDVFSSDSLNCWFTGGPDIIRTTDGGKKWFTQPPMGNVYYFNWKTGWGALPAGINGHYPDGALYKTEDGGLNWTEKQKFGGKIKFVDRMNGFVLGDSTLYRTTDGGETWAGFLSVAKAKDFALAGKDEGWIISEGGDIIHFPAYTAPEDTSGNSGNGGGNGGSGGDNGGGNGDNGNQDTTGNVKIPTEYSVSQNYPNPFNMGTNITYALPFDSFVSLKVLDITGREITTLINEQVTAGIHTVHFDAKGLSSGIYFYRITAGGFSQIKKLILMK